MKHKSLTTDEINQIVLIGPCGIETAELCSGSSVVSVLIGPCGIETSNF